MLDVQLYSASLRAAEAGGQPANLVAIIETRPGEADEPRRMIRRAIRAIEAPRAAVLPASVRRKIAPKVIGLMRAASLRAQAIGGWSSSHDYDPLPDFQELQKLAARRLGRGSQSDDPVRQLVHGFEDTIRSLSEVSAAQRMGA